MPNQKILHDRHQVILRLDRELFDYIRSVANLETFNARRVLHVNQLINELILEAVAVRVGNRDITTATNELKQELARALGVDDVDAINQTKL